ncbi:MAG TPA: hypothetical protein VNX68_07625 [Nitrosopumilaceae archaeon]|jgi:hypothetical protein|nr:hypothetical protein [Nitrosopumilaceae archaeon]
MFINGSKLTQHVVELIEREERLLDDVEKVNSKYETAANLNNMQEMGAIEKDALIIQNRFRVLLAEKVLIMTMYISRNKNYNQN